MKGKKKEKPQKSMREYIYNNRGTFQVPEWGREGVACFGFVATNRVTCIVWSDNVSSSMP